VDRKTQQKILTNYIQIEIFFKQHLQIDRIDLQNIQKLSFCFGIKFCFGKEFNYIYFYTLEI